ncbi:Zinc finger CW-type PWWP domain protein 1 like protein [Argiope bruennichi]|uniref:Zinc finger CW-type PWWP domain protein 1 like protein n=1 Tax=Argiope bruennichi TaxID=94029 RepID=A0A8T0F3G4_ARGBR|nr:Zinc finger CW-type PWWP domain protein 1 like protein [Argiope bruennichi]
MPRGAVGGYFSPLPHLRCYKIECCLLETSSRADPSALWIFYSLFSTNDDDHIESSPVPSPTPLDYTPGSLVWAKLFGHPYWPAIIEADPDLENSTNKGSNQDIRPMGWRQRLKG